jgi:outer membrane protein insertion porin family
LFFPVPFLSEVKSVRIGSFVDAGSISNGLNLDYMRYSAGLSGQWLSPFGAIAVSVAQPFNASDVDNVQNFQFTFGSGF